MSEYKFDPKFILTSLVEIYLAFKDFPEFLEFVVKDERSYRIENFEKVIVLKENEKIRIDYGSIEDFSKLINELRLMSESLKSKEVKYY